MLRLVSIAGLILMFAGAVLAQEARLITSLRPVTAKPASTAPVEPTEIEKRAFEQTNLARIKNGLPPFACDADICRMARIHSESMSRHGYFSHVTPDG